MADNKHGFSATARLSTSSLFSDISCNDTLDEDDRSLFITPSNVLSQDSSDEDDAYLSELLGGMAATSPEIPKPSPGGATGGLGFETIQSQVNLDPFYDSELDDSILIRCSKQVEEQLVDTIGSESDEDGDIASLLTRVRQNLGHQVVDEVVDCKPPAWFGYSHVHRKSVEI